MGNKREDPRDALIKISCSHWMQAMEKCFGKWYDTRLGMHEIRAMKKVQYISCTLGHEDIEENKQKIFKENLYRKFDDSQTST